MNKIVCEKISNVLGILLGIIAIGFAVAIFCLERGSYLFNYTFGADYYTESYNAMRVTALNIFETNTILKVGFGCLFVFLGLKSIFKNLPALFSKQDKAQPKQVKQNVEEQHEEF